MTDNELLSAMSELIDQKLQPINEILGNIETQIQPINERLDSLELQIKHTENALKNEIRKSEYLILDEVERVHEILDYIPLLFNAYSLERFTQRNPMKEPRTSLYFSSLDET